MSNFIRELGIDVQFSKLQNWTKKEKVSSKRLPISECRWLRKQLYITWDGFITPCCIRPHPEEFNFGNIFKEGTINIIRSKKYLDFVKTMQKGIVPDVCKNCPDYE